MSKTEYISSKTNVKYKTWTSLLNSKGIKEEGKFLLFGKVVVENLLQNEHPDIEAILFTEDYKDLEKLNIKSFCLTKELFKELDIFGTSFPILVLRTPEIKKLEPFTPSGITLLLPIGDPSNLGATLRSAAAFGVDNIVLLKEAVNPFHPKSVRAASGNLFSFHFYSGPSVHDLQSYAKDIYALDKGGENIMTTQLSRDVFLLVGEEGPGIPDFNFKRLEIPIHESCESLNASVAISIALYEITTRKQK